MSAGGPLAARTGGAAPPERGRHSAPLGRSAAGRRLCSLRGADGDGDTGPGGGAELRVGSPGRGVLELHGGGERGAGALGRVTLRNGTLELRELRTAAAGRFLCQGLFPEWGRLRVGYAAVMLRVLGKVSLPPALCAAPLANGPHCWPA